MKSKSLVSVTRCKNVKNNKKENVKNNKKDV